MYHKSLSAAHQGILPSALPFRHQQQDLRRRVTRRRQSMRPDLSEESGAACCQRPGAEVHEHLVPPFHCQLSLMVERDERRREAVISNGHQQMARGCASDEGQSAGHHRLWKTRSSSGMTVASFIPVSEEGSSEGDAAGVDEGEGHHLQSAVEHVVKAGEGRVGEDRGPEPPAHTRGGSHGHRPLLAGSRMNGDIRRDAV